MNEESKHTMLRCSAATTSMFGSAVGAALPATNGDACTESEAGYRSWRADGRWQGAGGRAEQLPPSGAEPIHERVKSC